MSGIGIGYIFFIVVSRWYGAAVLGIFSVCFTILMIAGIAAKWGTDTLIIRYISEDIARSKWFQVRHDYFRILTLVIFFSLIVLILILIFNKPITSLFFKNEHENLLVIITALTILPFAIMGYTAESFRGLKNVVWYSVFQNGSVYILILLIITLLRFFKIFDNYIIHSLFISVIFLSGISVILFIFKLPKSDNNSATFKRSYPEILKISTPMMLTNSLYLILNWTDIMMIGGIMSKSDVGIYNAAVKTAALGSVALAAMNTIAAPKFAENYSKYGAAGLKSIARQTATYSLLLSFPVFLIIFIFPGWLLSMFGHEFTAAVPALVILTIGQFMNTFSGSTMYILNMTGREIAGRNILFSGAIINVLCNLLFIPIWGITGAALATALSTVMWNLTAVMYIRKKFGFITFPYLNLSTR